MTAQLNGFDEAHALLLARARALGIDGDADAAIEALLEREVRTPEPTGEECRRYYERNPGRFRAGELVEASHILFAMTSRVPPGALRAKAAEVLETLVRDPSRFAQLAAEYSNCPSAGQGGSLGQLGRGDAVPEFEAALFADGPPGVLRELVTTRFGFHIVLIARRSAGRALPFEQVREAIGAYLQARSTERAVLQYLQIVQDGASPLVQ